MQLRFEPERANTDENKARRAAFAQQLLTYQGEGRVLLFMDETNFNLHCVRRHGRSKKGDRCSIIAAGSKGANIHLIGTISERGILNHEVRRGSFNIECANEYVRSVFRKAVTEFHGPVVLVADNAPCHSRIEQVILEEEFRQHTILRLSPYSPMLNPIEEAWSVLKAGVKQDLATELPAILSGASQGVLPQSEFRLRKLEEIIARNMPLITPMKCRAFVNHIQRFVGPAIERQNLQF